MNVEDYVVFENQERVLDIEGIKVNQRASEIIDKIWSMSQLNLPKVWIFEGDDGPEHYNTVNSLVDYVSDFGGRVVRLGHSAEDVEVMNGKNTSSGKFLVQVD